MTTTFDTLAELDFPAHDEFTVLIEAQRELARTMLAPSTALAIPETETFEEKLLREHKERLDEQHRVALERLLDQQRRRMFDGSYCFCSPGRGMMFEGRSSFLSGLFDTFGDEGVTVRPVIFADPEPADAPQSIWSEAWGTDETVASAFTGVQIAAAGVAVGSA